MRKIVLTMTLVLVCGCNKPGGDKAKKAKGEVPGVITVGELERSFADNEVAAEAKFTDKMVSVSGTVEAVDAAGILMGPKVRFTESVAVVCYFKEEDKSLLANLKRGDRVTMKGLCGSKTLGSVAIYDCQISQTLPQGVAK